MQTRTLHFYTGLIVGCSLIVPIQPALAADAADVDPTRFDTDTAVIGDRWTGFYGGFSADLFGRSLKVEKGAGVASLKDDQGALMLGAQLGYNFGPIGGGPEGWMFGVESDLALGNFDKRKSDAVLGNMKSVGTFVTSTRLRAGYAWEDLYLYATAGLAASDFNIKPAGNRDTDIFVGVASGIGAEYALSDVWSMKAEVIGYNFGERKYLFNGTSRKVSMDSAAFRIGFNRKF